MENTFKILHPETPELLRARNALVQESLRSEPLPYPVEEEYPLVLGPHGKHFSYCLVSGDELIAHANLWPRTLTDFERHESYQIGLIGNVATAPKWRGRGIMRELFNDLKKRARESNLEALVLWSDLYKFYQNLGFESHGTELRFFFDSENLPKRNKKKRSFVLCPPERVSVEDARAILQCRYRTRFNVEMTAEEYRELLRIPQCFLFAKREGNGISAFGILGRGFDMKGVIHSWGAGSPGELLGGVADIGEELGLKEVILLAPGCLKNDWKTELGKHASRVEDHMMAMSHVFEGTKLEAVKSPWRESGFIWGMDSI